MGMLENMAEHSGAQSDYLALIYKELITLRASVSNLIVGSTAPPSEPVDFESLKVKEDYLVEQKKPAPEKKTKKPAAKKLDPITEEELIEVVAEEELTPSEEMNLEKLKLKCTELQDESEDKAEFADMMTRILKNTFAVDRLSKLPKTEYATFLDLLTGEM